MLNFVNLLIILLIILIKISQSVQGFDWHDETNIVWAERCDWKSNDLSSTLVHGPLCGPLCAQTARCTHFTWTGYNGGTCWMKQNPVTKDEATTPYEYSVCGLMNSSVPSAEIEWHEETNYFWAERCDWLGNFLSSAIVATRNEETNLFWEERCKWTINGVGSNNVPSAQCGLLCALTAGCTHFTWTTYNGGTCWMKQNSMIKDQALISTENSVCGLMKTPDKSSSDGGSAGGQVTTINRCSFSVWVGAYGQHSTPENGGWKLDPGQNKTVTIAVVNGQWSGRFWGRTDCNDKGKCSSGQCAGGFQCNGTTGQSPASLAEITFNGASGLDFYHVSLVDGYNLPIKLRPKAGSFVCADVDPKYDCTESGCDSDLNAICPNELALSINGKVVACKSACEVFKKDEYCCVGAHNNSQTCLANDYSRKFKQACPRAYSYAYDDKRFTCKERNGKGASYEVQFC